MYVCNYVCSQTEDKSIVVNMLLRSLLLLTWISNSQEGTRNYLTFVCIACYSSICYTCKTHMTQYDML